MDGQSNKPRATSPKSSATCSPQMAAQRTAIMFGCYRRGDANDPETYVAAVAAVLAGFSEDVVAYVTDPRTGIPGELKWLPSVAEIKEACIKRRGYLDRLADFERRFGDRTALPARALTDGNLPGRRANVRVRRGAPQYDAIVNWTKTADHADW